MIEVPGEVIERQDSMVRVRAAARSGGCGRCNEPGGCGSAKVGSMFRAEHADIWVEDRLGVEMGERVLVCLDEGVSMQAALLGYMIPVVGIVIGAAIGVFVGGDASADGAAVVGALAGLGGGVLVSRWMGRGRPVEADPVLKRMGGETC
ncbi:MAG: SoxR reducing system RseC family protein [Rhodocyclaceae bacterium]|nr:SoxR reducing system RseC family protein [Rhodocyclaceae bacterium]